MSIAMFRMQTNSRRARVHGVGKSYCQWKAVSEMVVKFTSRTKLSLYRWHIPRRKSCSSRELLSQSWCELWSRSVVLYSWLECAMGTV